MPRRKKAANPERIHVSQFKIMWNVVAFDLPMNDRKERRAYAQFRKFLKRDGYFMMQESVYARPCPNADNLETHKKRLLRNLPPYGQVRILAFTDAQFAKMEVYYGRVKGEPEKPPDQLTLF